MGAPGALHYIIIKQIDMERYFKLAGYYFNQQPKVYILEK